MRELENGNGAVICFDFDGVINSYESGYTKDTLPDPPVEGVREFLVALRAANWKVVIASARFGDGEEAFDMVENYCIEHEIPYDGLQWGKPKAKIYVDDRGFYFDTDKPEHSLDRLEDIVRQATEKD